MSISSVASVVRDKKEQLQRRQGPALLLHSRTCSVSRAPHLEEEDERERGRVDHRERKSLQGERES